MVSDLPLSTVQLCGAPILTSTLLNVTLSWAVMPPPVVVSDAAVDAVEDVAGRAGVDRHAVADDRPLMVTFVEPEGVERGVGSKLSQA